MNEFSVERCLSDPAVFAENRLPAHSDHIACRNEEELAAGESSLRLCLDGVWKFHYAANLSAAPEGFWKEGADLSGWDTIRVPAHIQMEGYDKPAYVNTQYPWDALEELRPGQVPGFFNPVADYVTEFELPERFRGMQVNLSFQGVESGFACWLNGKYLGYCEDSFTPSDFCLDEALREGQNRLAVRVFKWTPGSWFEDQDFFRFSGIYRSVYLYALPETALLDLKLRPELSDDYRRGRLTNHKVYGEDIATLAGDALQPAAFLTLCLLPASPAQTLRCVRILAEAAGEHGMVAGQVLDLSGETRTLTEAELRDVHLHKTGDLIRAACQMGTVLGGGSDKQIDAAGEFALHLGMAFQIRDDILDCVGTAEELGKPIGSDAENGKSTFVTLFGLDRCQELVEQETDLALDALQNGGFIRTDFLENLAKAMVSRRK